MTSHINESHNGENEPPIWRHAAGMAVATAAIVAGFYLLREHGGHMLGLWPYLLLLACPLMHLMHGHGGHSHSGHADHTPEPQRTKAERE